eukprot:COSAG05_NODE_294_length_11993_cov_75.643181_12_plen_71_part_00
MGLCLHATGMLLFLRNLRHTRSNPVLCGMGWRGAVPAARSAGELWSCRGRNDSALRNLGVPTTAPLTTSF